jgi:CheY-like chemotaxis protein
MKKITVVEDNADNRLLIAALLDGLYLITAYEGAVEALEGMLRDRPDLVLLDISLPGMDGTALLRRLRATPALRDLPVIAVTAHAMAGDRERYLALGFDHYVAKPIDEEELLGAIRGCLQSRGGGGGAGGGGPPRAPPRPGRRGGR